MKFKLIATFTFFFSLVYGGTAETALLEARKGFKTELVRTISDKSALAKPPDSAFSIVKYPTAIGDMQAYLSRPENVNKKYPAIIWITGGFPPGGIGEWIWEPSSYDNDQSALAYHEAGVVMMYPSFRGSCGNPGKQESFLGEVDDVLAALKYLQKVPYVDPKQIYLGGHSTGGTLALLTAEATKEFKAVFAFGAVSAPSAYGPDSVNYDPANKKEDALRSPAVYINAISSPTYLIEGSGGNIGQLEQMAAANKNPKLHCFAIKGASHFDALYPLNEFLAEQIANCAGAETVQVTQEQLQQTYDRFWAAQHESEDLETLATVRSRGTDICREQVVSYYLWSDEKPPLEALVSKIGETAFKVGEISEEKARDGSRYYLLVLRGKVTLSNLNAVFKNSKYMRAIADRHDVNYSGWFVDSNAQE